jgi:hypothetical protein
MMTITSNRNMGGNYWGSLVRPDKSPSPLLVQLCLGIAQLMVSLSFRLVNCFRGRNVLLTHTEVDA